jgi:hypothetical protein
MKISSSHAGRFQRLDSAQSTPRAAESPSKAFSLKAKAPAAQEARAEAKAVAAPAETPVAAALRSVATDFKAGRIGTRDEAVRKMVSTMLREQYGPAMTKDQGFQKMEQSISDLISDDPMLSKRMESLLQRLA